ncbi:MAG: adenylyltransferase/cytidyltransferase family protein, partial [Patescibacteria group bacterium]|nr:adenylyltransferase/cytidyltransferase family protein [Patescibacteria group bacterium]
MNGGIVHDLFGPGSDMDRRYIKDYAGLKETVDACRRLGLKIVATSGTYDLLHIGHGRYLELAKSKGDILIVGACG